MPISGAIICFGSILCVYWAISPFTTQNSTPTHKHFSKFNVGFKIFKLITITLTLNRIYSFFRVFLVVSGTFVTSFTSQLNKVHWYCLAYTSWPSGLFRCTWFAVIFKQGWKNYSKSFLHSQNINLWVYEALGALTLSVLLLATTFLLVTASSQLDW